MSTLQGGGVIVRDGLVLYLDAANVRSYPGSGDVWSDLSRSGNNGSLVSSPTFNSGNGGSLVFNGSSNYIRVPYNSGLRPTSFTLSIWLKRNQLGNYSQIIGLPSSNTTWNTPFRTYGFEFIASTNTMSFTLGYTDNTYESLSFDTFGLNQWFNVVGTYNVSSVQAYVNGVLSNSRLETKSLFQSTADFYIGSSNSLAGYYLDGVVGNAMLYNRALSESEVLQNYNATKSRFGL